MNKTLQFLGHLFGFEKLTRFEKDYLHEQNIQSSIYMGGLAVVLEIWMLLRQTYTRIIPKVQAGGDLFEVFIKNTSKYWLLLFFGLGLMLFSSFRQQSKEMTRKQYIALLISGILCILYTVAFQYESFVEISEGITPVMANIENAMLIAVYVCLLVFGVTVVTYAIYKYKKKRNLVILEHMAIVLYTLVSLFFGVLVSYSDFWGGKNIICFLMMTIYVGCLLIYRPYITVLILSASFYGFYRVLCTYEEGVTFKAKEIMISGAPHRVFSGDTLNYIMFIISLATICIAMYHQRLSEARKTASLEAANVELERKHKEAHEQFVQTAEALATAIDAKDTYTNGHSRRVAEYSEMIAREAGKDEEECERIYFAALLHDVGKIGVPNAILQKKGKLTDEEYGAIKDHPVAGGAILSKIDQSPWLRIGALYHHERYDGKGYPEGLKGEDIPELARIIAVADAYDAMTSNRSYRAAIPQQVVREELVKGTGAQFDPDFARIMIRLVDADVNYTMKENATEVSE